MGTLDLMAELEKLVTGGRVPGTSRCLVNLEKFKPVVEEIREGMPEEIQEAGRIIRQKEAIITQAEIEARRIRAYADDEATTIRQLAEEESKTSVESAREQSRIMVQETEVAQAAEVRAEEIVDEAKRDGEAHLQNADRRLHAIIQEAEDQAEQRRSGADAYAREILFTLEESVSDTLGQVRKGIDLLGVNGVKVQ